MENWNYEEQKRLAETKCERCGFPCDLSEKLFCDSFCADGGAGK